MNKTHGKTDELAAVDAVSQTKAIGQVAIGLGAAGTQVDASTLHATGLEAIGTHHGDVMQWYRLGIEHGMKGGVISGQLKVLKVIGDTANAMEKNHPDEVDPVIVAVLRTIVTTVMATLQPTGPRT